MGISSASAAADGRRSVGIGAGAHVRAADDVEGGGDLMQI
jgi:hypothetical protein